MNAKLQLPQVTLCCVDTRLPQMALDAMRLCMDKVLFGDALLFTCPDHGLQNIPSDIRMIELPQVTSIEAYSHFLLKGMGPYLHTSHMLIVQWDGYVIDPGMWRDDFLKMDYIGAVWPQFKDRHRVGNGGFSLRSRKLLDALAHEDILPHHPEDICIARTYRTLLEERWGIQFASEHMAHQFAFERERKTPSSFGFHGLSNFPDLLSPAELIQFTESAPASLFGSTEARRFIKKAIESGRLDVSALSLRKRRSIKNIDSSDVRLMIRLLIARLHKSNR